MRGLWESPFNKRLSLIYRNSPPGVLSRRISDFSHLRFVAFGEYLVYKLSLYRVQRRIGFLSATIGGLLVGYL